MSKIIESLEEMHVLALDWKKTSNEIVLVPTMGSLHEGHMSLINIGKKKADIIVVSIFLNPSQFNSKEDLLNYPINLENDIKVCMDHNVDVIFVPKKEDMFKDNSTWVYEDKISKQELCDKTRTGHFQGVCTVVLKLFNLIQPNIAVFGEKDAQQLRIIEKMIIDLNIPIRIIRAPIIRDSNGLALSSRNKLLSNTDYSIATNVYSALCKAESLFQKGEKSSPVLVKSVRSDLDKESSIIIEYIEVVDNLTLSKVKIVKDKYLIVIAVLINEVRLIDNIILKSD